MKQAESLMTFKEQLTAQADNFERTIEINEEIERIKERMQKCWADRAFTINLIVPFDSIAIGGLSSNFYNDFVPKAVSPLHYRQLFIEELKKLGFDEFELYDTVTSHSHTYSIKVVW
jgi:hypothetical protein